MDEATSDLDSLVQRFERPLVDYATRLLGERSRAHDVVQEVFTEVHHRLRRDDPTSKRNGYLLSAAIGH